MKNQLTLSCDAVFKSTIFSKFINNYIFGFVKLRWEKLISLAFFVWKKFLLFSPLIYFYEALLKLRPLIRCRVYLVKKKRKKHYKLQTPCMSFSSRWCKAVSWLVLAIKTRTELDFIQRLLLEVFYINFMNKSEALNMKTLSYKKITEHKGSKHFKW
jgi:ribosomal protein S7